MSAWAVAPPASPRKPRCNCRYTRRRLRGLAPLCGMGVTSRILVTKSPCACRVRIAASLPAPGPLTKTSICRSPFSFALRAASSAARWAANAVDLRDPLKPAVPELPQQMTLPSGSTSVIIVLLKVDCMYAFPTGMDLRSLRLVRGLRGIYVDLSCFRFVFCRWCYGDYSVRGKPVELHKG